MLNHFFFDGKVCTEPEERVAKNKKPYLVFNMVQNTGPFATFISVRVHGEKRVERWKKLQVKVGDRLRVDGPIGSCPIPGTKSTRMYLQCTIFEVVNRSQKNRKIDRDEVQFGEQEARPFDRATA